MMLNRLIAFSIRRRVLVFTVAVLISIAGLLAAMHLPIGVLPDLTRPSLNVMTEVPGLQPEDIEAQVATPLESALIAAPGVENVRTVCGAGFVLATVEFGWNSDPARNRQIISERLAQIASSFAPTIKPTLLPSSSIMGEVMLIGLSPGDTGDLQQLRAFADWTLRPRLLASPGVAQVSVIGGSKLQWQVLADPQRMRIHGVTFSELKDALTQAEATSGGVLPEAERTIAVQSTHRIRGVDELSRTLVKINDGIAITVADVATVRAAPQIVQGATGAAALNGKPALIVAIQKQPAADTLEVTNTIDRALADLKSSLPPGANIDAHVFRQSSYIGASIKNLSESVVVGAVLSALVLFIFLFRFRASIVTLAAVPLSLLTTALVFKALGQSINCMTLGGIAIAIGELADDAIVDIENIHRRLRENAACAAPRPFLEVVYQASVEIRSSIVFGSAVVLLALTPLFFLPGLAGRLFAPLAGAYVISIFMSMAVALTLTPALSALLMRSGASRLDVSDSAALRFFKSIARGLNRICLPRPGVVMLVLAILLGGATLVVCRLGTEYLPPFNESSLTIEVKAWPGISLAESDRLASQVEDILLAVPEVRVTSRRTGRAELDEHAEGIHSSEIDVAFFGSDDNSVGGRARPTIVRTREAVLADIRARLRDIPVLSIAIGQPISHRIDHLLSGVKAPVVVQLRGPDINVLRRLAAQTSSVLEKIPGLTQIQSERPSLVARLRITPKRDAMARYGFSATLLNETVHAVVNGELIPRPLTAQSPHEILLWSDERVRERPEALQDLPLVSPTGAFVRLGDVAELDDSDGPFEIRHENGVRQVTVSCSVTGRDLGSAVEEIQRQMKQNVGPQLPNGYAIHYAGEYQGRAAAARVLWPLAALLLALSALLLFSHFKALTPTLLVLINIPFAFIGAVAALALMHEPLSLASLVGFITLAGIASRNGVLLISHYARLIGYEGQPFGPDTIVRGSQERVAPVLMTALTTGLALVPLVLTRGEPGKEMLHPLALTVIGGLISTTLLDFAVTPALFLRFGATAFKTNNEPATAPPDFARETKS